MVMKLKSLLTFSKTLFTKSISPGALGEYFCAILTIPRGRENLRLTFGRLCGIVFCVGKAERLSVESFKAARRGR